MTGEFKFSKGILIFIAIIVGASVAGFTWMIFAAGNLIFTISLPVFNAVMLFALYDSFAVKLLITPTQITLKTSRYTRHLLTNEISCYSINQNGIDLFPKDPSHKKISISLFFSQYDEILHWVKTNFKREDERQAAITMNEILSDQTYGSDIYERNKNLKLARRVAMATNIAMGLTSAWAIFFPHPYEIAMLSAIAMPLIVIIIMGYFRGMIKINDKKKGNPSVGTSLIIPGIILMLRILFDYNILLNSEFWIASIALSLLITAAAYFASREMQVLRTKYWLEPFVFIFVITAYTGSSYSFINCYYDNSQPRSYQTIVLDKEIHSGKTTSYYLITEPWGPGPITDDAQVGHTQFDNTEVGDSVTMIYNEGRFKMPWYYVLVP